MTDLSDDGLCGVPSTFATRDGMHFRCKFDLLHGGAHSWKKYEGQFTIMGGVTRSELNRAMHPVPKGCICQALRADSGEIVEYLFKIECVVHSPK